MLSNYKFLFVALTLLSGISPAFAAPTPEDSDLDADLPTDDPAALAPLTERFCTEVFELENENIFKKIRSNVEFCVTPVTEGDERKFSFTVDFEKTQLYGGDENQSDWYDVDVEHQFKIGADFTFKRPKHEPPYTLGATSVSETPMGSLPLGSIPNVRDRFEAKIVVWLMRKDETNLQTDIVKEYILWTMKGSKSHTKYLEKPKN